MHVPLNAIWTHPKRYDWTHRISAPTFHEQMLCYCHAIKSFGKELSIIRLWRRQVRVRKTVSCQCARSGLTKQHNLLYSSP